MGRRLIYHVDKRAARNERILVTDVIRVRFFHHGISLPDGRADVSRRLQFSARFTLADVRFAYATWLRGI